MRDPAEFMVNCHPQQACVLITHLIVCPVMKIAEIGPIGVFLLMSIASLLPGWGVSLLARHHEYSSCIAKFSCAVASSADVPMQ